MLSIRAVIVLHEHDLQLISHGRVSVDDIGHAVDIADDSLGAAIAGCGLGAKDKGSRRKVGQRAVFQ